MVKVVIDTDIFIDYTRANIETLPALFTLQAEEEAELFVSSATIFELFSGLSSKSQKDLLLELINTVKTVYVDDVIAKMAGELNRDLNFKSGMADILIASTALSLKAELATKNKRDFQYIPGLKFFEN